VTNAQLARRLRDLRDYLIIAGYDESHATRYTHIARSIETMPESVEQMRREGRLKEIPQVGPTIALYIKEILDNGICSKQRDWESFAPFSVVEMCRVPGLGPKSAKLLFEGFGIKSLAELKAAVEGGKLNSLLSEKAREAILETELSESSDS